MKLVMMMELRKRKFLRLNYYDYGQEGCYFVTLCTHKRQCLFDIEPYVGNDLRVVPQGNDDVILIHRSVNPANQIIIKWIMELQNKYDNLAIDKYVIMPDHLHFIVSIKERHTGRSLPDVMQFFKTMTTNEYMRGVKNGILPPFEQKIWQKSYYDHVIRNEQDYLDAWEYIDGNPVKWLETHP